MAEARRHHGYHATRETRTTVLSKANSERFQDMYIPGRKLGAGQFGTTYMCTDKKSGLNYAVKVISKSRLVSKDDIEDVRREVALLYHVQDQPNIVSLKSAHEDKENVYMVMELCTGGELYDTILERIQKNGVPYSERDAAQVAKVIVQIVEECHSLGVVHRDLKPENFLLSSRDETAQLMATDFGLSTFFNPGEGLSRHCGSPMYMAPEVVRWRPGAWMPERPPPKYGPEVDIWSAGVIIYALLSGFPPFYHRSHSSIEIFKAILRGNPSFSLPPWPSISDQAKDLVRWMLQPDPAKRPKAHEVLTHPWIAKDGVAPHEPLPPVVADRLRQFSSMVKMKKVAMQVIATGLKEEEIAGLKQMFKMVDTDNSGTITIEELRVGLKKLGSKMTEAEIQKLMEEADVDKSGEIEYGEFLAATMHLSKLEKKENLTKAFEYFDTDGSGTISMDELREACRTLKMSDKEIEQMMKEVDTDKSGTIDYDEFVAMMLSRDGQSTEMEADDSDFAELAQQYASKMNVNS